MPMAALFFFFFNDTATTEIYTLSLHDALPISHAGLRSPPAWRDGGFADEFCGRSEEHTSELQSQSNLVCRLLLEKKKSFALIEAVRLPIGGGYAKDASYGRPSDVTTAVWLFFS